MNIANIPLPWDNGLKPNEAIYKLTVSEISGKFTWRFHGLFANSQEYTHTEALLVDLLTPSDLNLVKPKLAEVSLVRWESPLTCFLPTPIICVPPFHILLLNTKLPKSVQSPQPWWRSQEIHTYSRRALFGFKHKGKRVSKCKGKSFL